MTRKACSWVAPRRVHGHDLDVVRALGQLEGVRDALVAGQGVAAAEQVLLRDDLARLKELDAGKAAVVEGGPDDIDVLAFGAGADERAFPAREQEVQHRRRVGEDGVDHCLEVEPGGHPLAVLRPVVVRFQGKHGVEADVGVRIPQLADEGLRFRHELVHPGALLLGLLDAFDVLARLRQQILGFGRSRLGRRFGQGSLGFLVLPRREERSSLPP